MEPDKNKGPENQEQENENTPPDYEQNGGHFTEDDEIQAGKGMLHHGRPLSEAEIEELRIHKENNEFLGIPDIPELGTGAGNVGGMIPDQDDLLNSADDLDDRHNPAGFNDELSNGRDSNFGRSYAGGMQSFSHFIETHSHGKAKKDEDKVDKKDEDKKKD